ncbi:TolC family protein [Sphingobacterium thalpophilum]|uniref:TolC family protein n=1 Tax=Sphingobacterium thalpophilum TaxID=259 RepID=UPI003D983C01
MKLSITFFIISCVFSSNLSAQIKLTLSIAKDILEHNNTNIKQSVLREKISRIELDQSYDNLWPNLGFSINNQNTMGLNFDQVTGQLVTGNQWAHYANASLTSSVTFFQGFRDINTIRLNKVNLDLSRLDTDRLRHELQIQLVTLFFRCLINYDLYQVSTQQANFSAQLVLAEEHKISTGKSTLVDLAQAKSKLANDELNKTNAKNAYDLSVFKLKQLLEIDSEIEIIKPELERQDPVFLLKDDNIFINDPYIKLANKRIDQSILNKRIIKSNYYPTLNFNGGYGTNFSSRRFTSVYSTKVMPLGDQINNNRSLYLNLSLSFSIFDKNITKSSIAKINLNTENLLMERDKVSKERAQNIHQLKMEYQAAIVENKAIESAYNSSKVNYQAMKERFNVGKSSSIDLFKALTDFNMNEFKKITSIYNIHLKENLIKLELAIP